MRQNKTTHGERIVKDIKRKTRKQYSPASFLDKGYDSKASIKRGLPREQQLALLKEELAFNNDILSEAERNQFLSELGSVGVTFVAATDVGAATIRDGLGWSMAKTAVKVVTKIGKFKDATEGVLDVTSSSSNEEIALRTVSRKADIPFFVPDTYTSAVALHQFTTSSSQVIKDGNTRIDLLKIRNQNLSEMILKIQEKDIMDYKNKVLEARKKAMEAGEGGVLNNRPIPVLRPH